MTQQGVGGAIGTFIMLIIVFFPVIVSELKRNL